ncbi:DNA-directed RNA polymerase I subunit RPA43 [Ambystoma mexicanum]|uniref:DNA-directed RNA polymerase I subunit RPA43 n=1 Tax=Ambystoma mexicanum TaxID=8296 RepID=UPI0037E9958A
MEELGNPGSEVLVNDKGGHDASKLKEPVTLSATVLPSFPEACSLMSRRYSCLVLDSRRRHMALSPKYLSRKRTGIHDQLNVEMLRYSEGLNGVPVAYNDIKIVGELGDIHDDQGYIHLNIEAEFVIFRPKTGEKLVGVVNKVAPSHIGCLVHGCFNASIPKPPKMHAEEWQNLGVKIGDQFEFEVFRLDSDAVGVFCIRGRLNVESKAVQPPETPLDRSSLAIENMDQNELAPPTKRKSLNGENVDSGTEDAGDILIESLVGDTGGTMDNAPTQEKRKKKRKKHKQQDLTVGGSDSCDNLELKKDKKKKRQHSEDGEISQEFEPKAKKKRIY